MGVSFSTDLVHNGLFLALICEEYTTFSGMKKSCFCSLWGKILFVDGKQQHVDEVLVLLIECSPENSAW